VKIAKLSFLTIVVAALAVPLGAQSIKYNATLIAGGSPPGAGVNGSALNIPLEGPTGVTFGSDGTLYFAEFQGGRVRKVDASGNMTTIAGGGTKLLSGEKGHALDSVLMGPATILFDGRGNLFIAEQLGNRIRKVNKKGTITTIAGNGDIGPVRDCVAATQSAVFGPNGLAFDSHGNLFVSEFMGNRIRKISPDGIITTVAGTGKAGSDGDGGPALSASLNAPTGLAIDADGNVFVAEIIGYKVRKIDTAGNISTVIDNMNGPTGLAFDQAGSLWIAEHFAMNLRKLDKSGQMSIVQQRLDAYSLAFDRNGALHASQEMVGVISRVDSAQGLSGQGATAPGVTLEAGTPQTPATTGVANQTALKMPAGVARDSQGNTYIAEVMGNRIRRVDAQGMMTTVAGTGRRGFSGDGGPAVNADLDGPGSLGFDDQGNMYIVEIIGNRVRKVDPNGTIQTIAGTGDTGFAGDGGPALNAKFNHLHWGAFDKRTGLIYLVDTLNYRIRQIDRQGIITTIGGSGRAVSSGDGGLLKDASFARPEQLAIDSAGNWYITDSAANMIKKVDTRGIVSTFAGTGKKGYTGEGKPANKARLFGPTGIAVGSEGTVYFTDIFNDALRRVDPQGNIWYVAGNPPAGESYDLSSQPVKFVAPWGLAINSTPGDKSQSATPLVLPEGVTVAEACAAAAASVDPTPTSSSAPAATARRHQHHQ